MANGYIRVTSEHAVKAWFPVTPSSHQLLARELQAAARVVTGCPAPASGRALLAEAGLAPVAERCVTLTASLLAKGSAPPVKTGVIQGRISNNYRVMLKIS